MYKFLDFDKGPFSNFRCFCIIDFIRMDSRTSSDIISTVADQLKIFTLPELVYVLEQDSKLSCFDIHRIEKITDAVRYRFDSKHCHEEIRTLLQLLSNEFKQTLPVDNQNSFAFIFNQKLHYPVILPFTSVCHICKRSLSALETKQRSIKIYCVNGSVVSGMISKYWY